MGLIRREDGTWTVELVTDEERTVFEKRHPHYREVLTRYLTCLAPPSAVPSSTANSNF